jgi:hypothetical protein
MKKNQKTVSRLSKAVHEKKKAPAKVVAARKTIRAQRPLHRHIALHPITVFTLLCVGVLLATLTLNALAASYTVTLSIPAPPLTLPAVITSPADGYQTSTEALTVSGTCPDNSYVNLSDNGSFVGTYTCVSNTFQIALDLSSGENQLQAQDYNVTDAPGPTSGTVTVTYTPPPPPPAPPTPPSQPSAPNTTIATPQELIVTEVSLGVPYVQNILPNISYQPTIAGIAPAYSRINIVIHTNPYTCNTTADAQGYWSCTLSTALPAEVHTVDVTAITPQGNVLTYPPFKVKVVAGPPPSVPAPAPFHITSQYAYREYNLGQPVSFTLHITGGAAPYAFTVLWGDGKSSTIIQQTANDFTITHSYTSSIHAELVPKVIKIQAVDSSGQASTLQLSVLIHNPAYHGAVVGGTKSHGPWDSFATTIRSWLWVLWPGYLILLLLLFSFWLGERQEYLLLMEKKRRRDPVNQQRHAHMHR